MGGKSKSTNQTSSVTNTDQSNTQINENEGLVVGENANVNVLDGEAIDSAFQFSESSLESVENIAQSSLVVADNISDNAFAFGLQSLDSVEETANDSLRFSSEAINAISSSSNNALNRVSDLVSEQNTGQSTSDKRLVLLLSAGMIALAVFALVKRR